MVDGKPRIGDEVYIHGYIDEIRNDVVIIRNEGGYFGTSDREMFYYEEDERGYGTMNEADRKTEPQEREVEWVYNKRERLWYPYSNGELLFKTESNSEKPNNCEHITEDGVTCARYPACDDCPDNPLNKVKGSERLVKGTEQTEPRGYCNECKWYGDKQVCGRCRSRNLYTPKDEPQIFIFPIQNNYEALIEDEPQTDTEIAKAIVHKMIDDAVIAEDAYPDLRQRMHEAVDEYEPQTDCAWK